jgi:transcriptional regulator GlxA family with amidase domain
MATSCHGRRQDRDEGWLGCHSPASFRGDSLDPMTTNDAAEPGEIRGGHIGILLFDGVEELDAIGPWEALSWWTMAFPEDGFTCSTFSADGKPVTCNKGLIVTPHHARVDLPAMSVLVHPGGDTRALAADVSHLEWLQEVRASVPLMTSVCTGSLVYAAAGLLKGRPATTYWGSLEALAANDPSIEVRGDDRWVDDGDVITAAGVSAGIDMALHLVARLAGDDRAREVRRGIQYDPEPPV